MNGDEIELRDSATRHLKETKAKIAKRAKEFVTKRVDPRTVVMARPSCIKDIIKQINND